MGYDKNSSSDFKVTKRQLKIIVHVRVTKVKFSYLLIQGAYGHQICKTGNTYGPNILKSNLTAC